MTRDFLCSGGFDRATSDPSGGKIDRDAQGSLFARETASAAQDVSLTVVKRANINPSRETNRHTEGKGKFSHGRLYHLHLSREEGCDPGGIAQMPA